MKGFPEKTNVHLCTEDNELKKKKKKKISMAELAWN